MDCGSGVWTTWVGSGWPKEMGSVTLKVEPIPTSLSRAIVRQAVPRGAGIGQSEPGALHLACNSPSIWTNSSKIRSWSSGAIPIPVSDTRKTMNSSFSR